MISELFEGVDRLMRAGVELGVFPGAVLWVAHHSQPIFCRAYGSADLFSRRPMTIETVFDLASLTKPLATTLAVMDLVQQGALDLDQALSSRWPVLSDTHPHLTVRSLLAHSSGMPAWRPYYMRLRHLLAGQRQPLMRQWLLHEPVNSGSAQIARYSDLGFLLLQWVVEDLAGLRLDRFVEQCIYRPLGLRGLFFIDLQGPRPLHVFAATELCPWRNRLLVGEVHDDNAYVLGGVAGHAGLFGTAGAVGELLLALLSGVSRPVAGLAISSPLIRTAFERQPGGSWALGFDTPSPNESSAGHLMSAGSVGHLGYTGTSFWMDLQAGAIIVLLTNRVHPSRYNARIKGFRPQLHDQIMTELNKIGPGAAQE